MIKESSKVAPFLVMFLVHSSQIGVGVLGFQRVIMKSAGFDGWVTVILTGLLCSFLTFLIYYVMKQTQDDEDIFDVNQQTFGKVFGWLLSFVGMVYLLAAGLTVLRTFLEVIQVWMFPRMAAWPLAFILLLLCYYVISGGFKVVAGIAFLGVLIPLPLLLTIVFPIEFAHFTNLLPILKEPYLKIIKAVQDMTLSYLGFEHLLVFYPFIREKETSQKWAQIGIFWTTVLYTIIMVVSLAFYSEGQLSRTIWATLSMFKIVQMPFLERFEYIGISLWLIVIIPNVVLTMWAASRLFKKLFGTTQRRGLVIQLVLLFIGTLFITERHDITMLNGIYSKVGLYLLIAYIPLLAILFTVKKKWKMRQKERGGAADDEEEKQEKR